MLFGSWFARANAFAPGFCGPIAQASTAALAKPSTRETSVLLNLQAGWETAAIVVMAILVGGLLAFGLSRDIRRRLRARRGEEEAA